MLVTDFTPSTDLAIANARMIWSVAVAVPLMVTTESVVSTVNSSSFS
jgi:hypothetical protein